MEIIADGFIWVRKTFMKPLGDKMPNFYIFAEIFHVKKSCHGTVGQLSWAKFHLQSWMA